MIAAARCERGICSLGLSDWDRRIRGGRRLGFGWVGSALPGGFVYGARLSSLLWALCPFRFDDDGWVFLDIGSM